MTVRPPASRAGKAGARSTMLRAICALLAMLVLAAPAQAVPDVPLEIYLEHIEPLALEWPADGTVTTAYEERWGRMHSGADIGILRSLDVRAAEGGTVTAAGWLAGYEGYGIVVAVDIGGGYTLLYAHLAAAQVVPGQWVDAGEAIGIAGCTGSCTGTHLHFELRARGAPIDPFPYLK